MEYRCIDLEKKEIPYKDFTGYDREDIARRFAAVIEGEGPVVDDFLELKVLKSYGIYQRGSLIAPFLRGVLLSAGAVMTRQIDCDGDEHLVFWPERFRGHEDEIEALKFDGYTDFRPSGQKENMDEGTFRSIADFPQIEIYNAMTSLFAGGEEIKRSDVISLTNKALGFLVKGRQIRETLENVLRTAIANRTFIYNRRAGLLRLR
ncbi:MAG: hypothetical protein IKR80_08075 [Spirochaetales bacterium]|nr:hypothetical protein [Spirochaetales bacterium]MBR6348890.1 hypothetical protein [Spirochaetales bacterium]